jgi:hypothetical protein
MKKPNLTKTQIFLLGIAYAVFTAIVWQQFIHHSSAYFRPLLEPKQRIVVEKELVEVEIEPEAKELTKEEVKEKIRFYADMFGINPDTALRIAECESGFNPKAENINGSATGVYQFIRQTWKNNCHGDVYDADANIVCFFRMYPKHPEWWECK